MIFPIGTFSLSGTTDIDNIPDIYDDLIIIGRSRMASSSRSELALLINKTTNTVPTMRWFTQSSGVEAQYLNRNHIDLGITPGSTDTANVPNVFWAEILNYSSPAETVGRVYAGMYASVGYAFTNTFRTSENISSLRISTATLTNSFISVYGRIRENV